MFVYAVLLSLGAGLAITLGGFAASRKIFNSIWLQEEVRHTVTAVGGGALISAIAFVLVPDGADKQSDISTLITFAAGGVTFMLIDKYLARSGSNASQLIAMLLDFVPEAIVLGVVIGDSIEQAIFIASVIVAQNFPEGYSAYSDMKSSGSFSRKKLLTYFLLIGLTGPIYVSLGSFVFINSPQILGALMTYSGGGILYLVFQDVAPNAIVEKSWLPPLGAVLGFMIGLAGHIFMK